MRCFGHRPPFGKGSALQPNYPEVGKFTSDAGERAWYTDGTSSQFTQSFSDWFTPQSFAGEYEAVAMPYRNFDDGTEDKRPFNLYAYLFPLNHGKVLQSITVPNNPDVVILAATLYPAKPAN